MLPTLLKKTPVVCCSVLLFRNAAYCASATGSRAGPGDALEALVLELRLRDDVGAADVRGGRLLPGDHACACLLRAPAGHIIRAQHPALLSHSKLCLAATSTAKCACLSAGVPSLRLLAMFSFSFWMPRNCRYLTSSLRVMPRLEKNHTVSDIMSCRPKLLPDDYQK